MRLDSLDERIIALLRDDARASYAVIGQRIGLSAPAVKRRVDRLRADGAIRGFTVLVNPAVLGWTTEAYVELFCSAKTAPADIQRAVSRFPEVVSAVTVTGEADALLRVLAEDVRHLERVVEQLGAIPFVARTKSAIVLSTLLRRPDASGLA